MTTFPGFIVQSKVVVLSGSCSEAEISEQPYCETVALLA
jgi:hypothetical protein